MPSVSSNDPAVSTKIVHAVANATGRDPLDLPPLYDVLDATALDSLVGGSHHAARRDHGAIDLRFRYAGVDVRVRANGDVAVAVGDDEP